MSQDRRHFIKDTALTVASGFFLNNLSFGLPPAGHTIRVVVWDERQPKQKQAYENFMGNQIAEHLRSQQGFSVQSVCLDDAEQGLSDSILDNCDVLIWWGHLRHGEVLPEKGIEIVRRILSGSISFIALHSAHWSTPFVETMNEVTRRKVRQTLKPGIKDEDITFIAPPIRTGITMDTRLTPFTVVRKFPQGPEKIEVYLPNCVFPTVRNSGKPSTVMILKPGHPIVKGIPPQFELPQTEVYGEPFHVPDPDEVILEERWAEGDWFRSGMLWLLGKGSVFYFRPGHETYPIYKQKWPLQILTNAVQWMGNKKHKGAYKSRKAISN